MIEFQITVNQLLFVCDRFSRCSREPDRREHLSQTRVKINLRRFIEVGRLNGEYK